MKINLSNELKIGVLALVALGLLFWGFNFLKGRKFDAVNTIHYAKFNELKGLQTGNSVVIKGFKVGTVGAIETSADMRNLTVKMVIDKNKNIPNNSIAYINKSLLGNIEMEIVMGNDSVNFVKNGGYLKGEVKGELTDELKTIVDQKLDPILNEANKTLSSVTSLTNNANSTLTPNFKNNLDQSSTDFKKITLNIEDLTRSMNALIKAQSSNISNTLGNVEKFSTSLNGNTGNITASMESIKKMTQSLEKTTNLLSSQFSKIDLSASTNKLNETMDAFKKTAVSLQTTLDNVNKQEGSLGLLMKDEKLYKNFTATINKMNLLLDDFKTHPKRYINVSVFGKKDKSKPLNTPLPDTLHAPYYNN